jgi:hypothetical protein
MAAVTAGMGLVTPALAVAAQEDTQGTAATEERRVAPQGAMALAAAQAVVAVAVIIILILIFGKLRVAAAVASGF